MTAYFELSKSGEQFKFVLKSSEDQTLLSSESYTTLSACQNGIESVKKNSTSENRYKLETSSNGRFYFNLTATNGQVIGTSPMYGDEAKRQEVLDLVKSGAESAEVKEL